MPGLPEIGVQAVVGGMPAFQRTLGQLNAMVEKSAKSMQDRAAASKEIEEADTGATFASQALTVATGALTVAVAAIVAIVGSAVASMEEMNSAMAKVAARTGEAQENLGGFRSTVENVFRTGLADNFETVANAVERAKFQIDDLTDNPEALQTFTTRALAMGKAWSTSASDITDTVDNLIDKFPALDEKVRTADFGIVTLHGHTITSSEGLDLLTAAAQRSHMPLGQINQLVNQYGSTFSAAGLSAKDFFGLIVRGGENGVDNFKVMQIALDNFHKGISKPPKGFNQALEQLGLKKTAYDLRNNTISMNQALEQVFKTMGDKSIPAATRANAAMALFGNGIDKIGGPDALAKLAGFTDAMDNVEGSAQKVADIMEDDGTLGSAIRKFGANMKVNLEQAAQWVFERIKSINWAQIGESISVLAQVLQDRINQALVDLGNTIYTAGDQINAAFQSIWDFVTSNAGSIGDQLKTTIDQALFDLGNFIYSSGDRINAAFQSIWSFVTSQATNLGTNLVNTITTGIDNMTNAIRGAYTDVSTAAGTIAEAITTRIKQAGSDIQSLVVNGINTLINFIPGKVGDVKAALEQIASAIIQPITSRAAEIWTTVQGAIRTMTDGIAGLVGGVQAAFDSIANVIKAALAPALAFIKSIVDAVAALSSSFSNAVAIAHSLHIPGFAGGGKLGEGWSTVGEAGAELVYKRGTEVQVISNQKSRAILNSAQQGIIQQAAIAMNVMPQASAVPVPGNVNTSTTNNNTRNMTVNMNGVQNGNDAIQRFAMLNATRKM